MKTGLNYLEQCKKEKKRTCKTCNVTKGFFRKKNVQRLKYVDDDGFQWNGSLCYPCFKKRIVNQAYIRTQKLRDHYDKILKERGIETLEQARAKIKHKPPVFVDDSMIPQSTRNKFPNKERAVVPKPVIHQGLSFLVPGMSNKAYHENP